MMQQRVKEDVRVDESVNFAEVDRPVGHCVVISHVGGKQLNLK
jgi:hypothetical protein